MSGPGEGAAEGAAQQGAGAPVRELVFALPDLGEGLTEAEVVAWRVAPGDRIAVDAPVAEVETAKAAVEVPCPFAGTVTALHADEGAAVPVGAPLVSVAVPDGPQHGPGTGRSGKGAAPPPAGSGAVLVGYGTGGADRPAGRRRRGARAGTTVSPPAPRSPGPAVPGSAAARGRPGHGGSAGGSAAGARAGSAAGSPPAGARAPVVSPLVRRLARENGVDAAALDGSGEGGLVLRRDVVAAISAAAAPEPRAGEQRTPVRGAHRAMVERLSRSRREIPEATVWVDADASGLVGLRRRLNAADPQRPVSLVGLVARFCVLGLARFPELNGAFDADRGELVRYSAVGLGVAAQTPRGLVVPVVRGAEALGARDLSAAIAGAAERGREGRLPPAELVGGTFTVNNYGVFGVDGSAAIINHPEAAILGLGRIADRPWVVGGELAVRPVTELTLAFDHRVCDGGTAGGFLRFVADCVEDPALLLGDL